MATNSEHDIAAIDVTMREYTITCTCGWCARGDRPVSVDAWDHHLDEVTRAPCGSRQ